MSTETDPLDVLERIHRDVKLLSALAGPALKVTIEAVKPPATPRSVATATAFAERVGDYLRDHPGERQAQIAIDLGVKPHRVRDALKRIDAVRGPARKAPGQMKGRASPTWRLKDSGTAEDGAVVDQRPSSPDLEEGPQPDTSPPDDDAPAAPELADGPPSTLSPRTRKSIEAAQEKARAEAALGDPPASRVLDILCQRAASAYELAAALATSQVLVAEEIHALKPWLVKLHDGKWRAVERLRIQVSSEAP